MKTIIALATAPLNCAIHIIRVSGDDAYKIVQKITNQKIIKKSFTLQKINIFENNNIVDEAIIAKYVAPKSFTGEDLIEINCHGGVHLVNKVIELLLKNGAMTAKPGEFSQRSVLNNKMSLVSAESINNIISSTNDTALFMAQNGLGNKLAKRLDYIINFLFKIIGEIEVNIDYPEYDDVTQITHNYLFKNLTKIKDDINDLLYLSQQALQVFNGINVAIVGYPNVGKSSLLNKLLQENKAIVSNIAGTTRDAVEGRVNYNNLTFNFIDTAGIRSSKNTIEKIGIKKSLSTLKQADITILVLDYSRKLNQQEIKLYKSIKNKPHIVVANKADLKKKIDKTFDISFSCKHDDASKVMSMLMSKNDFLSLDVNNLVVLQNTRQIGLMKQIFENINWIIKECIKKQPIDLLVEKMHESLSLLNELVGKDKQIDFFEKLFRTFCLGK